MFFSVIMVNLHYLYSRSRKKNLYICIKSYHPSQYNSTYRADLLSVELKKYLGISQYACHRQFTVHINVTALDAPNNFMNNIDKEPANLNAIDWEKVTNKKSLPR